MTYELNTTDLDEVYGGTSVEEAMQLMKMWNTSITLAGTRLEGEGGIVGGGKGSNPFPPTGGGSGGGGGCHSGCH